MICLLHSTLTLGHSRGVNKGPSRVLAGDWDEYALAPMD